MVASVRGLATSYVQLQQEVYRLKQQMATLNPSVGGGVYIGDYYLFVDVDGSLKVKAPDNVTVMPLMVKT